MVGMGGSQQRLRGRAECGIEWDQQRTGGTACERACGERWTSGWQRCGQGGGSSWFLRRNRGPLVCYHSQQPGHIAKDCISKMNGNPRASVTRHGSDGLRFALSAKRRIDL